MAGGTREFLVGVARTGGVLAAFLGFGLGWSTWLAPAPAAAGRAPGAPPYAPAVSDEAPNTPKLWLIDGYNVVCANLLGGRDRSGWWRSEHRGALLDRLAGFDDPNAELWIAFDGELDGELPEAEPASPGKSRVHPVFARDADAWLLEQVTAHPDELKTADVAVVTSDRKLADRARHRGARVVEPRALLRRCTG